MRLRATTGTRTVVQCNYNTATTALCRRSPVVYSSSRVNSSQCFVRWYVRRVYVSCTWYTFGREGGTGSTSLIRRKNAENACRLQQAEQIALCLVRSGQHMATATSNSYSYAHAVTAGLSTAASIALLLHCCCSAAVYLSQVEEEHSSSSRP